MDVNLLWFFAFLFLSSPPVFILHVVGLLPASSFFQPACCCLQKTWRLTVICSRFPKPTIWARRKLTGLRSHVPVLGTMATHLGGAGMVSNTPTMTMMSLQRKTCGTRMSTAMEVDTHLPVTTDIMAVLAATHLHHVIQMSRGPPGHQRGIQKIQLYAMTLQDDLRPQEGVENHDLEGTTLQTTPGTRLVTITASAPPDRGTHTGLHAASLRGQWTCRVKDQVCIIDLYIWHWLSCKYVFKFPQFK